MWKLLILKKETFTVKKQETHKNGRVLILDISINDFKYILTNISNANTDIEQINALSNMFVLLEEFDTNPEKSKL